MHFEFEDLEWEALLEQPEREAVERGRLLLEAAGAETISYLRSLTAEMQPPVRRSEGPRAAHPGHWADITGDLARGYGYAVEKDAEGATLRLWNGVEYAAALEAKDGYFVLRGVTESGGPLEGALRRTAARLGLEIVG